MDQYFVRYFELASRQSTLKFFQKIEGDVSCVVWDASIVLAKYLERKFLDNPNNFKNRNVLELGAGVGCVGIAAACLGANVTLTDLQETLPLLNKNIEENSKLCETFGGSAKSALLLWGKSIEIAPDIDIILLADCIYYKESVQPLMKTLTKLSSVKTKIFLCQEMRESDKQKECWEYFKELAAKHFTFRPIPETEQNPEYCCPDIVLYELSLKHV